MLGIQLTGSRGYRIAAADGGIFAFGLPFLGSAAVRPSVPVVALAGTPSGNGYWEAGADGAVFAFGDAPFGGSTAGNRLSGPIVAIMASGGGYQLVGRDGAVYALGGAPFAGSLGGRALAAREALRLRGGRLSPVARLQRNALVGALSVLRASELAADQYAAMRMRGLGS